MCLMHAQYLTSLPTSPSEECNEYVAVTSRKHTFLFGLIKLGILLVYFGIPGLNLVHFSR